MNQWRVSHFPENQTDPQAVRHFQPYADDDHSMNINNSNMVHFDNPRPSNPKTALNKKSGGASKSPEKRAGNHSSKNSGQQEPKGKPRGQSYYQRILSYAKNRSPKSRQEKLAMNAPMNKTDPSELKLRQQDSTGLGQTGPHQPKKPAKYQSSGHPAEGPSEPRINNQTFDYNDGAAQAGDTRISDLFSPARGRHDKSGQPNGMTQS